MLLGKACIRAATDWLPTHVAGHSRAPCPAPQYITKLALQSIIQLLSPTVRWRTIGSELAADVVLKCALSELVGVCVAG